MIFAEDFLSALRVSPYYAAQDNDPSNSRQVANQSSI